jgi:hypothetical protein
MDDWWVLGKNGEPVGPASSDLIVQGIRAGVIPGDSYVCVVGGNRWEPIRDVPKFGAAFTELLSSPHISQIHGKGKARRFVDGEEATIVDATPFFAEPSTIGDAHPTIPPQLPAFDELEERTIVEQLPPRPSEPP